MRSARGLIVASFAALVLVYTVHAASSDLWDDALFFQRFGHNMVEHGVAAWNVADGPVHGNTSQLFQLVAALVTALAPGRYHLAIKLVSALSMLAAFLASSRALALWQEAPDRDRPGPAVVLALGLSAPTTLLLVSSGMETLFAMSVLAGTLLVLAWRSVCDDPRRENMLSVLLVTMQVLVYLARPDMVLVSVGAMGLVLRRSALPLLLATGGALAFTLLLLKWGYGTAFPLSFYLKTRLLTAYDASYQALGAAGELRQIATWAALAAPFVYVASYGQARWTLSLLVPALGFVLYHYLSTLGIMAYHSRFYQPAMVPVALAAALAWPRFASGQAWKRALPLLMVWPAAVWLGFRADLLERPQLDFYLAWMPAGLWALAVGAGSLLAVAASVERRWPRVSLGVLPLLVCGTLAVLPPRLPRAWDDEGATNRIRSRMIRSVRGIDLVEACMEEPLHLYHSELGLPGVMFPESRVTDLSGLMNPELAFSALTFDELCLRDPPDVLFLPHVTHERRNEEIAAGQCIRQFERVPLQGPSSAPLHVRRDRMAAFLACASPR